MMNRFTILSMAVLCALPFVVNAETLSSNGGIQSSVTQGSWNHYSIDVSSNTTQVEFILDQLSNDADLYVRKGQAPTTNMYDCRPYKGNQTAETCLLDNTGSGTWYVSVNGYRAAQYRLSNSVTEVSSQPPATNQLVPGQAKTDFVAKGQWQYYEVATTAADQQLPVALSQLTADVDLYVRKNQKPTSSQYDCRPYKGNLNTESCDFELTGEATWFVGVNGYQAGSYELLASVVGAGTPTPTPTEPSLPTGVIEISSDSLINGSVSQGEQKHYAIRAQSGDRHLMVSLAGLSGDLDLYVRANQQPSQNTYDCRPYKGGVVAETCSLDNDGETIWFITVDGYKAGNFQLTASLESSYPTVLLPLSDAEIQAKKAHVAELLETSNLCIALDDFGLVFDYCFDGEIVRPPLDDTPVNVVIEQASQALLTYGQYTGVQSLDDLVVKSATKSSGMTHSGEQGDIKYQIRYEEQVYQGIPVLNGDQLRVSWDVEGGVNQVWGGHWFEQIAIPEVDQVSAADAKALTIGETVSFNNSFPPYAANDIEVTEEYVEANDARKVIYIERVKDDDGKTIKIILHVAWEVKVSVGSDGAALEWSILIDTTTGEKLDTITLFISG